jgi:hypothetical protein
VCGPSPTHMPGYIRSITQAQQFKIDSLARTLRRKGYTCDRTVYGLPNEPPRYPASEFAHHFTYLRLMKLAMFYRGDASSTAISSDDFPN